MGRFADLCADVGVRHISLLSSAWADRASGPVPSMAFANLQREAVESYASNEVFKRVSVFQPAVALDKEGRTLGTDGVPGWASVLWRSMPIATQFLPTRFRPIPLDDIVLALRLNAEICDASERVEMLGYRDMMQIIGRILSEKPCVRCCIERAVRLLQETK